MCREEKIILKKIQKQPPQVQKQSPEVFYKKRYFQKFRKLDRKTPALKLFLNKVEGFDRASFF